MTRIEKIAKLAKLIEALKAELAEAKVAGRKWQVKGLEGKVALKLAERDGIEVELYEQYGIVV